MSRALFLLLGFAQGWRVCNTRVGAGLYLAHNLIERYTMGTNLAQVETASEQLRAARAAADEALANRNRQIEIALEAGVGQTAIATAAGTSQAVVSRIDRARNTEGAK